MRIKKAVITILIAVLSLTSFSPAAAVLAEDLSSENEQTLPAEDVFDLKQGMNEFSKHQTLRFIPPETGMYQFSSDDWEHMLLLDSRKNVIARDEYEIIEDGDGDILEDKMYIRWELQKGVPYYLVVKDTFQEEGQVELIRYRNYDITPGDQFLKVMAANLYVAVGKKTYINTDGARGKLVYQSSNTNIASVSDSGIVKAKKVGTVKITVTAEATRYYKKASESVTIKVVPAATSALSAENAVKGIDLTWKAVSGADGYYIYRKKGSGSYSKIKNIKSGKTLSYHDADANTNGALYTFKVVAYSSEGASTLSTSTKAYRLIRSAISSLNSSGADAMALTWSRNSKGSGYQIQYSRNKSFSSAVRTKTVSGRNNNSIVLSGLKEGKIYYVRIRNYKSAGGKKYYSAWSKVNQFKSPYYYLGKLLKKNNTKHYDVALVDSGILYSDKAVDDIDLFSVIDDTGYNTYVHGTKQKNVIRSFDPDASIASIKVMDADQNRSFDTLYCGLQYAASLDVDCIMISKSINRKAAGITDEQIRIFTSLVKKLQERGIPVFSAAGNQGKDASLRFPACIPEMIIVGCCDENGVRREISNYGETVDFYAVGKTASQATSTLTGIYSKTHKLSADGINIF